MVGGYIRLLPFRSNLTSHQSLSAISFVSYNRPSTSSDSNTYLMS
jgi:hypothetical protein